MPLKAAGMRTLPPISLPARSHERTLSSYQRHWPSVKHTRKIRTDSEHGASGCHQCSFAATGTAYAARHVVRVPRAAEHSVDGFHPHAQLAYVGSASHHQTCCSTASHFVAILRRSTRLTCVHSAGPTFAADRKRVLDADWHAQERLLRKQPS